MGGQEIEWLSSALLRGLFFSILVCWCAPNMHGKWTSLKLILSFQQGIDLGLFALYSKYLPCQWRWVIQSCTTSCRLCLICYSPPNVATHMRIRQTIIIAGYLSFFVTEWLHVPCYDKNCKLYIQVSHGIVRRHSFSCQACHVHLLFLLGSRVFHIWSNLHIDLSA